MQVFRKTILLSLTLCSLSISAQLNGDGFYRVQNCVTGRYISVIDNKGSVDIASASADMDAIETISGFDNVVGNPASIIYIQQKSAIDKITEVNLLAQNTSVYDIIRYYVKLYRNNDNSYLAYAQYGGIAKYLSDIPGTEGNGILITTSNKTRKWNILPVSSIKDNFFGIIPELCVEGKYYAGFYASFALSMESDGMKAYYISEVKRGIAIYKEIEGIIPPASPVFIQCAGPTAAENKANPLLNGGNKIPANALRGVYFNIDILNHRNHVANDTATMRTLGICSDGKLGFVKSTAKYMPANKAYLLVSAGTPDELPVMSQEEFQQYEIEHPEINPGQSGDNDKPGEGDNPGEGGDNDNPGQGGDNDNPGQGGDNDNPGQGGDNDNSGQGDNNDNPGQGGDNDNPGQGGDNDNPGQGDNNDNPGQGGDNDNPGQGGDNDNPGQGDNDNPGQGGDNDNPGQGGDDDNPSGINTILEPTTAIQGSVYTIFGQKVAEEIQENTSLTPGIYIIGGKKVLIYKGK